MSEIILHSLTGLVVAASVLIVLLVLLAMRTVWLCRNCIWDRVRPVEVSAPIAPDPPFVLTLAGWFERGGLVVDRLAALKNMDPRLLAALGEVDGQRLLDLILDPLPGTVPEELTELNMPEGAIHAGLESFSEATYIPDFIVPKVTMARTAWKYGRLWRDGMEGADALEHGLTDLALRGGGLTLGAKAGLVLGAVAAGPVGAVVAMLAGGFAGNRMGRTAFRALHRHHSLSAAESLECGTRSQLLYRVSRERSRRRNRLAREERRQRDRFDAEVRGLLQSTNKEWIAASAAYESSTDAAIREWNVHTGRGAAGLAADAERWIQEVRHRHRGVVGPVLRLAAWIGVRRRKRQVNGFQPARSVEEMLTQMSLIWAWHDVEVTLQNRVTEAAGAYHERRTDLSTTLAARISDLQENFRVKMRREYELVEAEVAKAAAADRLLWERSREALALARRVMQ